MGARLHHSALCVRDLDASLRFYCDGLGLEELMSRDFEGDWPSLFGAPSWRLRSVFLGDLAHPESGVVELVVFEGDDESPIPPTTPAGSPPRSGFFLLSFFVDVAATLDRLSRLGHAEVRRIEQPGPRGPVAMATVHDPDGVLVELVDRPPSP